MQTTEARIRTILETDHLPEYAEVEMRETIEYIRNGGEHPPWLSREEAIAGLEEQIKECFLTQE